MDDDVNDVNGMVTYGFRVPRELLERARAAAALHDHDLAGKFRKAMMAYVEKWAAPAVEVEAEASGDLSEPVVVVESAMAKANAERTSVHVHRATVAGQFPGCVCGAKKVGENWVEASDG